MYLLLTKSLDFPPRSYNSDPATPYTTEPLTARDFGPQQKNKINMLAAPAAGPSIQVAQFGDTKLSLREIKSIRRRYANDFPAMHPTKMTTMHEGDIFSDPHATAM